jgi:signal transduction histidine kinase
MNSLRLRLLAMAVIGIAAALVIAGIVIVLAFDNHVRGRFTKELDDHLLQVAALLVAEPEGKASLSGELSDPLFQRPLSGLYWQVSENGKVVARSRSLWDESIPQTGGDIGANARQVRELRGPKNKWLIVVERAVTIPGPDGPRTFRIAVAGEQCVVNDARREFAKTVALSLAVLGGLLVLASWAQVKMGLAPLGALRRQLEALRAGKEDKLTGRFPVELEGLTGDLNRLLDSQSQAIERTRANSAKLAHGLKTPLAVLSTEARALRERGETGTADSMDREIGAMNIHVMRTLAAARAVGPMQPGVARTAIAPVLTRLAGVMKRLPRGSDLTWEVDVAPEGLEWTIDRRDLEELAGNLMDNARKWAASRVRISARLCGNGAEFVVEDDGPGIPLERVEEVLTRGARLDEDTPGTGVGLGIVADLANLHGGSFSIGKSVLGGVRAELRFECQTGGGG